MHSPQRVCTEEMSGLSLPENLLCKPRYVQQGGPIHKSRRIVHSWSSNKTHLRQTRLRPTRRRSWRGPASARRPSRLVKVKNITASRGAHRAPHMQARRVPLWLRHAGLGRAA